MKGLALFSSVKVFRVEGWAVQLRPVHRAERWESNSVEFPPLGLRRSASVELHHPPSGQSQRLPCWRLGELQSTNEPLMSIHVEVMADFIEPAADLKIRSQSKQKEEGLTTCWRKRRSRK